MTQQGDKGRVLIVEDSPVIAVDAEQRLQDDGWFVVGPAYDLDHAFDLAKREQFDAAILDLAQVTSYFNYINRMADGLGVDLEEFMKG